MNGPGTDPVLMLSAPLAFGSEGAEVLAFTAVKAVTRWFTALSLDSGAKVANDAPTMDDMLC